MRTWLRKPLRDLKRIKARALTIVVMVAAGVGAYAGLYMSRDTLAHTRDTVYANLHLADLQVVTTPADPAELPPLAGLPGVARAARRFATPGVLEMRDGRPLACLIVYTDPAAGPGVNDLEVLAGRGLDPARPDAVVIERTLAEVHGYRVGDRITLNPYTAPVEVEVAGVVRSPECLIATVDSTVFFPMKGSLGVVFAPMAQVERVFGVPLYNQFSFLYAGGAPGRETEEGILRALAPLGIEEATRRQDAFAYRFLRESLKGFSAFIPSLVMVFGAVIFLSTSIAANRLVAAQRQEIGVLRAMGYRRREVLASYLVLAGVLSLAGGALGTGLAHLVNVLFASAYGGSLGLTEVFPVMRPGRILEGAGMAAGVVALAFSLPAVRLVRRAPQQILRRERREVFTGLPRALSRAGGALSGLLRPGTPVRYALRNLFRRFRATAATALAAALVIALGGAFLTVLHSVDRFKDDMFARERWDVMVNFRTPLSPERLREILNAAGIGRAAPGVSGFARVEVGGRVLHQQILGFPPERFPRRLQIVEGRMFRDPAERAIVLNRNWMDDGGAPPRVGDPVTVRAGGRQERLTVVGLMSDMTVGQAYVPLETARALLGLEGGAVTGFMAPSDRPAAALKEELYRNEEVADVFGLEEIRESMDAYMLQMRGVFRASLGVSIAVTVLFLLGSVLTGLTEREIEFATLRALGYSRRTLAKIVLTELLSEAAAAVLLSMPLAVLLAVLINVQQGKIYFPIGTAVRGADLIWTGVWALLFIPLAAVPGLRRLFRMNIAEVVRRKGMG